MTDKKKSPASTNTYLALLIVLCILLIAGTVILFMKLFPGLIGIFKVNNEKEIANYIRAQGTWKGYLCVCLMNIIQVVSIFLSGNIIYVSSGLIYTWYESFMVCYLSFLFTNCAVYWFARSVGKAFEKRLEEGGRFEKIMKKVKSNNPAVIIFLANLLPGIPNGLCPYMAAFMKLRFKHFFMAIALSSWLQIILYCIIGHLIIRGNILISIGVAAIEWILAFLCFLKRDKLSVLFR